MAQKNESGYAEEAIQEPPQWERGEAEHEDQSGFV